MKKIVAVSALALLCGSFVFTSCSKKKDWTCRCTWNMGGSSMTQDIVLQDVKEKDAEKACEAQVAVPGVTWSCDLVK